MRDGEVFLNESDFGVFDFGVDSVSVDLKPEFDFLSRRDTIGLELNFSLDPAPTVAKHATLRLQHLSTKQRLQVSSELFCNPNLTRVNLVCAVGGVRLEASSKPVANVVVFAKYQAAGQFVRKLKRERKLVMALVEPVHKLG